MNLSQTQRKVAICTFASFLTIALFGFATSALAKKSKTPPEFPRACRPIGFKFVGEEVQFIPAPETWMHWREKRKLDQARKKRAAMLKKDPSLKIPPIESPLPKTRQNPQTVYLIQNISHDKIMMERDKPANEAFSPTYKNTIHSGEWGALSLDQTGMKLHCSSLMGEEEGSRINCSQVIKVCQYNNAKFAPHNGGTYWIVPSSTMKAAVRATIKNGILLR